MILFVFVARLLAADDTSGYFPASLHAAPSATIGQRHIQLSFDGSLGSDKLYVTGKDGHQYIRTLNLVDGTFLPGTSRLFNGSLNLRFGVFQSLDFVARMPVYYDQVGWGESVFAPGDLCMGATFEPPFSKKTTAADVALHLNLYVSTGRYGELYFPRDFYRYDLPEKISEKDTLRMTSIVDNRVFFNPVVSASLPVAHLPVALRLSSGIIASENISAALLTNVLALEAKITSFPVITLELVSEMQPFTKGRDSGLLETILTDRLLLVPSAMFVYHDNFMVQVAADVGLSKGNGISRRNFYAHNFVYATRAVPLYGASIRLGYQFVLPKSRILSQGGGVGLPGDRDADGVSDAADKCKSTPEDRDGYLDTDGCPEYDNDQDGIIDEQDKCPGEAEDKDGFDDADGCPDSDNDTDGIPDSIDACPLESGLEEQRGCPDLGAFSYNRTVLTALAFEPGSSKIVSGTEELDKLHSAMTKYPKSTIEFQVHTDNQGSLAECARLSQSRADILKLYLVTKGVKPGRIKALGLGSEFPVTDNSTAEGRAKNQRVEVRRID